MIKATLYINIDGLLFSKQVNWPALPSRGDQVLLLGEKDGWTEAVESLWWDAGTSDISIDLPDAFDHFNEGLQNRLIENDWILTSNFNTIDMEE